MAIGVLVAAVVAALPAQHHRHCGGLITVRADELAAESVYSGTRRVSTRDLRRLGYDERCQRNPRARWYVRWFNHREARRHTDRLHPWSFATASWYDDSSGACASPAGCSTYGVANLSLPFGTRVEFCYPVVHHKCVGRVITAVVDDRGPYISDRTWDLDRNTAGAIGFSGVGAVGYRVDGS